MWTAIVFVLVAYGLYHLGHAHANGRYLRGRHRGWSLYWRAGMGPWLSVPGPFGTRIGHRL